MIVERYPKLNKVVGGSIPGHEIVSLLERKLARLSSTPHVNMLMGRNRINMLKLKLRENYPSF